jgi:Ca-activated chloride channel homolog
MNFFSFEYPLLILLLPPLLWCLYRCKEQVNSQYFVHLNFFSPAAPWLKLEWLLKIIVVVSLIVAMASPIMIDRYDPLNRNGIDIVLSIDGSGSMNASGFDSEDNFKTRFEIVQDIATKFILQRFEDNVGVVLYGDFAFIASPVTYEKEIIAEMISYLSHGMAGQNTAIGEGIAMSVRALQTSKAKTKIIILLSDGEHNSGSVSPKDAVTMAADKGIKIYTIGMGSNGEFDSGLLGEIASKSGGQYFWASNKEELKEIYEEIDTLEKSTIKSKDYLLKEYYYYYLLLLAFSIMIVILYKKLNAKHSLESDLS